MDILTMWTAQDANLFILGDRPPPWLSTPEGQTVTDRGTHEFFAKGSRAIEQAARASGRDVKILRIDWASDNKPWPACHCIELSLLMGDLET